MLRTAHLFSGAGGGLLADLILGHRSVLAIEWSSSCCRSLRSRVQEGWLPADLSINCLDIREFDFSAWAGRVDCIAAGFPCQDISCAGKGEGLEGARSGLVREVFRAIDDVRPGIVFLENSPEIRTKGRRDIVRALVERGYTWRDGTLTAAAVGAGHLRNRWWMLAANTDGHVKLEQERIKREQRGWFSDQVAKFANFNGEHGDVGRLYGCYGIRINAQKDADNLCQRLQISIRIGGLSGTIAHSIQAAAGYTGAFNWSPPDSGFCGMVDGVAAKMDGCSKGDRIKACGNGQVPLQAAAAWLILSGVVHGN